MSSTFIKIVMNDVTFRPDVSDDFTRRCLCLFIRKIDHCTMTGPTGQMLLSMQP